MPLTDDEKATLGALLKKKDEPDEPREKTGIGRVVNVALDLGDDAQVERAFRLGLLERPADPDDGDDGDDGDGKPKKDDDDGDGPRRRGFFDND